MNKIWAWSIAGVILTEEKRSTWKRTCPQCHMFHHTSYMCWPEIEPVFPRWESGG